MIDKQKLRLENKKVKLLKKTNGLLVDTCAELGSQKLEWERRARELGWKESGRPPETL